MNKYLKITIISVFIIIAIIAIGGYYQLNAPYSADEYESNVISIYNQYLELVHNDVKYMGTSKELPEAEAEKKINGWIGQMNAIQKRGFPSQYDTFQDYFTASMNEYLQWREYGRYTDHSMSDFGNSSSNLDRAHDSFNNVSVDYTMN